MLPQKLSDMESVGRIMSLYYSKPAEVLEIAKKASAAKK
jgi:hypothetical protein